ncbi:MAG: T9SS type A sorting domain-containing protein [Bacteroidales bacterium]|jgi:hypothetical protein|nr:T9SS type A sorting domain-containing protein [Bacteroidales bacterium]
MNKYILILIFFFINISLFSQEILINCGNPFLKKYSKQYFENYPHLKNTSIDTLELPFFDDFANSFIYPDSSKWTDKYAFINSDYAIDPVSIGVATLDAIDEFGNVYSHLTSMGSGIADNLTSQPINLGYQPQDSIYLSFYFQAGGYGNIPENRDSLVLQFKVPDTEWQSVWRAEGGERMEHFELVLIPIIEEIYLKKGFQFRFINYASVSSNYEPSWKSNSDNWNIDWVKLDKNRSINDTLMNDVAFLYNFKSILSDFEAVPWKHYLNYTGDEIITDSLSYVYKNSWGARQQINRRFFIIDKFTNDTICRSDEQGDSENIEISQTIVYNKLVECNYTSGFSQDSASFIIVGNISNDTVASRYNYRWNDTIKYHQNFYNYYAYDDGTAEAGYGIIGSAASIACKFTPLIEDTLKGVLIYFNKVIDEANRKNFYLTVWDDNNGHPGNVLLEMEGIVPKYSSEINQYLYYPLDSLIYIESTFYIGWRKTTNDVLNCGFDVNRPVRNKLFYNVTGEWVPSQFEGALMIRPVFDYEPNNLLSTEENSIIQDYEIYPNPATDILNINSEFPFEYCEIYDSSGKLLLRSNYNNHSLNISNLNSGIYFVQLKSDSKIFKTKKIMVLK